MKARIFGAGSIGNHLTFALRSLDFEVEVIDIDNEALFRMENSIYDWKTDDTSATGYYY